MLSLSWPLQNAEHGASAYNAKAPFELAEEDVPLVLCYCQCKHAQGRQARGYDVFHSEESSKKEILVGWFCQVSEVTSIASS